MAIPKVKDQIVSELERICKTQLTIPTTFFEANLNEANFGLDNMADMDFPVLVFINNPKNKNSFNEAEEIQRKATINCLLLNKVEKATSDYKSSNVNPLINQIRLLGDNLAYWINRSPISVDGGIDEWTADNVYQRFDADLYGVAISFDWNISTGTRGYFNKP